MKKRGGGIGWGKRVSIRAGVEITIQKWSLHTSTPDNEYYMVTIITGRRGNPGKLSVNLIYWN